MVNANMIDPTLMIFDSHMEALIVFGGFLVYVVLLALFGYIEAKTKEEKRLAIDFLLVFGSLSAVSLVFVGYFGWWR